MKSNVKQIFLPMFFCVSSVVQSVSAQSGEKPAISGLLATYYNGTNFEQKVLSRIEKQIGLNLMMQSPAPGVGKEYFSIRWAGKVFAPKTG
ncbi:MAG: PA14 domain-containing protein, partial [Cytophagales bacterium]|nr:PA14 domain-containing protein [Cytophagales bacterium]